MRARRGALLATAILALAAALPATAGGQPQLDARAWALIEARSGEVLAARAASERLPVASATKLMTAYVALRRLSLRERVPAAPYAASPAESLLGLRDGERVSVRDLLYGLILRSGNDAAHSLAVAAAGSRERFVRLMNRAAATLGLADTRFSNPIGLDGPGNYSSALDLARLGRLLLRIPAFARIAASESAVLRSLRPPRRVVSRNDLLRHVRWVNGIKTGHTLGAGYVLVGAAKRKGVQLVSAVLGAPSEAARDTETARLLDYGFSRYRERRPVRAGEELASASIRHSGDELALRAGRTVLAGVRPGQRLTVSVRAPEEVEGPLRRGAALGRALVAVDGLPVAAVPLRAARAVPEAGPLDRARSFLGGLVFPLAPALFAILLGAILLRRWQR